MSFENGERRRICPRKAAKARVTKVIFNPTSEIPTFTYEIPEDADIICDPDCPGSQTCQKKLGPIPLPIKVEICPMEKA